MAREPEGTVRKQPNPIVTERAASEPHALTVLRIGRMVGVVVGLVVGSSVGSGVGSSVGPGVVGDLVPVSYTAHLSVMAWHGVGWGVGCGWDGGIGGLSPARSEDV